MAKKWTKKVTKIEETKKEVIGEQCVEGWEPEVITKPVEGKDESITLDDINKTIEDLKKEEEDSENNEKNSENNELNAEEEKAIDKEIAKAEEKMSVIGQVRSPVFQKSAFIKTKTYTTPVPLYELPDDLRQYLINMGFGTNVYEKGDEWLQRHGADMEKIRELKKFISEHYRK